MRAVFVSAALITTLTAGVALPQASAYAPTAPARTYVADLPAPGAQPGTAVDTATALALRDALGRARRATKVSGLSLAVLTDDGRGWAGTTGTGAFGQTLTTESPMFIGSVTKTFVATLILRLAEEGKLDLDASVSSYLPNAALVAKGATVRHLLNHTSGVADLYSALASRLAKAPNRVWTSRELLRFIPKQHFAPGNGYKYSNTNYYLLGLVAQHVGGAPVRQLLDEYVTAPLGLSHTILLDAENASLTSMPVGWVSSFWTSGSMISTPTELVTFSRALFAKGLLTPAYVNPMATFHRHGYGLGVQRFKYGGKPARGHSGLLYTNTTLMLHFPTKGVSVAVIAPSTSINLDYVLTKRVNGDPSILELAWGLGGG